MSTTELATAKQAALPESVQRRGINESQWRTLFNLFPGGKPDSVLMVWDYCTARKLDPMKKPCHIVPMRVKGANGQWDWRDVVMPGIYEYRITAQRTGLYLGHTEPEYGEEVDYLGVMAPAWCSMTFFRWNEKAREKVPFPVKVWFAEVVGTSFDKDAKKDYVNDRWSRAPKQMLTKCAEAAGLREAFPEEIGGEATAEEMEGRTIDREPAVATAAPLPQPAPRRSAATEPTPQADPAPPIVDAEPVVERDRQTGTVVKVDERSGAFMVKLDTGFVCSTRDVDLVDDMRKAMKEGYTVKLTCKPPSDPKFAPKLKTYESIADEPGAQA